MFLLNRIRSWYVVFILAILAISASGLGSQYPGFRVAGRFLYDRCGEKVILRGVNKMIVWTDINGTSFPEIAKTGANCVRIVWVTTGDIDKFDAAIARCRENKMIPMVELHDATGEWSKLSACVDWWVKPEVVSVIQKHEEYLLVNIANECGNQVSNDDFKEGYTTAVTRMREAGIHVPLVIDGAKWGQDINILQATGPDLIAADPDHNLLFSVHMWWPDVYGYNDQSIINEIAQSVQMNLPLIVGEFGNTAANCSGVINYKLILEECHKNEIGWLAWSWGPGNSDCATMDMTTDSKFETLQGWGLEVAVTDQYSIQNTSVRPQFMESGICEETGETRFSVSVIASGRGSVTVTPNKAMVDSGETITITATADENNEFERWAGSADGSQNPLVIIVNENLTITAVFTDNGPALGAELVENSDFSRGDSGWTFSKWGGAEGGAVVVNDEIAITIETVGEFGYNAQLFTKGLDLSSGMSYVVSFNARAESDYELSMNVGLNQDPWTTYSGYQNFSVETEMKTFSFEFTMGDTSDRDARIVFDVGTVVGSIYFDDISVKPVGSSSAKNGIIKNKISRGLFTVYPRGNGAFALATTEKLTGELELINFSGMCLGRIARKTYTPGIHTVLFGSKNIPSGAYFVRLNDSKVQYRSRVMNIVR